MVLGHKIREVRISKGIKQSFVSKSLGRNPSWLSRVESGRQDLTAEELFRLSKFFGLKVDDFFCP